MPDAPIELMLRCAFDGYRASHTGPRVYAPDEDLTFQAPDSAPAGRPPRQCGSVGWNGTASVTEGDHVRRGWTAR
jgi:hypothetical protein